MPATPVVQLEMSLSRAEFLRGLNHLANEMESFSQVDESEWELCLTSHCISISFHELTPRHAGALCLPRARIVLDLRALSPDRREAFLRRFRRTFQRGGG